MQQKTKIGFLLISFISFFGGDHAFADEPKDMAWINSGTFQMESDNRA